MKLYSKLILSVGYLLLSSCSTQKQTITFQEKIVQTIVDEKDYDDEVVLFGGQLVQKGNNQYSVSLNIDIDEGWHLYADLPATSSFIKTELKINTPKSVKKIGELQVPQSYEDDIEEGVMFYKGQLLFSYSLQIDSIKEGDEIICELYFQTCNDYMCKAPETKVVSFKLQS